MSLWWTKLIAAHFVQTPHCPSAAPACVGNPGSPETRYQHTSRTELGKSGDLARSPAFAINGNRKLESVSSPVPTPQSWSWAFLCHPWGRVCSTCGHHGHCPTYPGGMISAFCFQRLWKCMQWIHILRAAEPVPRAVVNFVLGSC